MDLGRLISSPQACGVSTLISRTVSHTLTLFTTHPQEKLGREAISIREMAQTPGTGLACRVVCLMLELIPAVPLRHQTRLHLLWALLAVFLRQGNWGLAGQRVCEPGFWAGVPRGNSYPPFKVTFLSIEFLLFLRVSRGCLMVGV